MQVSDWKKHKPICKKAIKEQKLYEEVAAMMGKSASGKENANLPSKKSPAAIMAGAVPVAMHKKVR